jgi:hypothetical protein
MVIKDGYAGMPLEIRVTATEGDSHADIWTEMYDDTKRSEFEVPGDKKEDAKFRTEVLHYGTIEELIALRNEINQAIKILAGV